MAAALAERGHRPAAPRRAAVRRRRRDARRPRRARPARPPAGGVLTVIARVTTFAIDGVESRRVWVEADIRAAACRRSRSSASPTRPIREARERVRAAIVELRPRVPAAADHRQPRARLPAQDRPGVRPAARRRAARRVRAARPATRRGLRDRRRAVADRRRAVDPRRAGDRRGRAPAPARRGCCCRAPAPRRRRSCRAWTVLGIESLREAVDVLAGRAEPPPPPSRRPRSPSAEPMLDLADVRGQNALIPALEVTAAGGHNVYMHGPPGTGKTMLARRAAVDPAAAHAGRGDRRHAHPVGRRPARGRRPRAPAPVPRAAPHDLARPAWSAAARTRCRARRRSPTTASCSSTSCRSSRARASRRCASRSRTGT